MERREASRIDREVLSLTDDEGATAGVQIFRNVGEANGSSRREPTPVTA